MKKGKIYFKSSCESLFEYYDIKPLSIMDIDSSMFDSEEFRGFLSDALQHVDKLECEGRKIFPLHYNVTVFCLEYEAAERFIFHDENRKDMGRETLRVLSPDEYIPMVFRNIPVYTKVSGSNNKLLLTP